MLVLPAAIDRPRGDAAMTRLAVLADLVEAGDHEGVAEHLLGAEPPAVRAEPGVRQWARGQADRLVGTGVGRALRTIPDRVPVSDRELLTRVGAPVLILAQEGDPAHPASVARELAEVLPAAILHVLPPGGIMWEHRTRVRDLVGQFLTPASDTPEPRPGETTR